MQLFVSIKRDRLGQSDFKVFNYGDASLKIRKLCCLESSVPILKPVQETSLKFIVDFEVLTKPQIMLTEGGYIFVFELRSKEEMLVSHGQKMTNFLSRSTIFSDSKKPELYSLYGIQQLRPRTWKSMDRMIRWFSERDLMPPSVALQITSKV